MAHTHRIAFAVSCALALAACQAGPAESPAPSDAEAARQLSATAATAGGDGAQSARRFNPPQDGRLTTDQVRAYLAVRRRALELVQDGGDVPFVELLMRIPPAEARAAAELGRDFQGYRWVQARVAEVAGPAGPPDAGDLLRVIDDAVVKSGARIEEIALGRGQRAMRVESPDSAIAHNRAVVEPFVEELLTLEQQHLRAN